MKYEIGILVFSYIDLVIAWTWKKGKKMKEY